MTKIDRNLLRVAVLKVLTAAICADPVSPLRTALRQRFGEDVVDALPAALERERERMEQQAERLLAKMKTTRSVPRT